MWGDILKKVNKMTIETVALQWDAEIESLHLINTGINLVYSFNIKNQKNFLRITHSSLRSLIELNSAIDFQHFLYKNKAPICKPIKSVRDQFVEQVTQGNELFYAHVNHGIAGEIFHLQTMDKNAYLAWGESLARLHNVSKNYRPKPQWIFKKWQELWQETAENITKDDDLILNEYLQINKWLQANKNFNPFLFGLTHGDHRAGNVIYAAGNVYIIDFDEPVYHWFHADIARPLLDMNSKEMPNFLWFLEGYTKIISLNQSDVNALPWFARLKNLEMYLWIKNNYVDHDNSHSEFQPSLTSQLYNHIRQPELLHNLFK